MAEQPNDILIIYTTKNGRTGAMVEPIVQGIAEAGGSARVRTVDEVEWEEMQRHPELGYGILMGIESLKDAAKIVHAHHERFDGNGYPNANTCTTFWCINIASV